MKSYEPQFLDISDIHCKDTKIQFSVENILTNEYYLPATPKQSQKMSIEQSNEKSHKNNMLKTKKNGLISIKSTNKERERSRKKDVNGRQKGKIPFEQRETEDNSETVKIGSSVPATKLQTSKKQVKKQEIQNTAAVKNASNKIQLVVNERSRTKSNASVKVGRKKSLMSTGQINGRLLSSNISLSKNQSREKIQKGRSTTFRGNLQQLKQKNENQVRNDYFEEREVDSQQMNKITVAVRKQKKRSSSISKKDGVTKKFKKAVSILPQKFNMKSPKTVRK